MFDYASFFDSRLAALRHEARYRVFRHLRRDPGRFPRARIVHAGQEREVTVWCSNDYLGMSQHPVVIDAATAALARYGAGAGGTRNISGTHDPIVELECELATVHGKEAALVFSSGYVANDTTLATLAASLPGCVIISDSHNHASMIEGMRRSRAQVRIFRHSDAESLAAALESVGERHPRIVAFESLYSMDGDIAPLAELLAVARAGGALTYVDETHAVGVYGPRGGGLIEAAGLLHQVDVIQGGLGKGYGVVGGFITGSRPLVEFVRTHAPGFIFTTALPPADAAAALASVRHLKTSGAERQALMARVKALRRSLAAARLPLLATRSQILPLMVGDAAHCQALANQLLEQHGIYLQAINYPTVARGSERLRITPSPLHSDDMAAALTAALSACCAALPRHAAA